MKDKLINTLKTLFLFTLFFTISSLPILLFKIDLRNFSDLEFALYGLGCDIVFLIIIIAFNFKTLKKDFKNFFNKKFGENFEQSFKIYLIGLGVMIISNLFITFVLKGQIADNEAVRNLIDVAPFIMLLEVSLCAPFSEELLFRKSLRDIINNKWLYIFLSGFIFGSLHVIGTKSLIGWLYLIPYSSLGWAFAYTYYKTDNIFSTISMHFLHNTVTIVLYLIGAKLI